MSGRRWIRLDVSWEDSWLDALTGAAAGCWPRLLCWVKRDGVRGRCKRPRTEKLARVWRVTVDDVQELEAAAVADGALVLDGGDWVIPNWLEYNPKDASSADRVRKLRKSRREGNDGNGVTSVTEPDVTHVHVARDVDVDVDVVLSPNLPKKPSLPVAAAVHTPAATRNDAIALLGNGGAEALGNLRPQGGIKAALIAIRSTLLYENEAEAMPEESVKGLSRVERRQLVARALMEMQAAGKVWNSATLAGFIRNLRTQPARAGPRNGRDPWAMAPEPEPSNA